MQTTYSDFSVPTDLINMNASHKVSGIEGRFTFRQRRLILLSKAVFHNNLLMFSGVGLVLLAAGMALTSVVG